LVMLVVIVVEVPVIEVLVTEVVLVVSVVLEVVRVVSVVVVLVLDVCEEVDDEVVVVVAKRWKLRLTQRSVHAVELPQFSFHRASAGGRSPSSSISMWAWWPVQP